MKKLWICLLSVVLVFCLSGMAGAITFQPVPQDLYDLPHQYWFEWGIYWEIPDGEYITSASLFFDNVRNWTVEENSLYVHLLDSDHVGVNFGWDGQGGGDYFFGQGVELEDSPWSLGTTAQDITYDFNASEIAALTSYAADGNFGIGFDPDCHYYNCKIQLNVETAPVPEPATMLLLGTGLIGFAGLGRKKLFKK